MTGHPVLEIREPQGPAAGRAELVDSSGSITRYWLTLAALTITVIVAAAIRWSLAHPFGIHWDEAGYLNEALIDVQRLRHGMLVKFGGRILLKSWGRPPAYRILADPWLALLGGGTTAARLVSLACYCLSGWYVYRGAALLASRAAGAFAALIFCLSPEVIAASSFFGTDAALYLATAATLFYMLRSLTAGVERSRDWLGLGCAMALGFLAKTSFFLVAPPALVLWMVLAYRRQSAGPRLGFMLRAAGLSFLLAGPWWLLNFKGAIAYGQYARGFVRNSLGTPSMATWAKWLNTVVQSLIGQAVGALIVLILVACVVRLIRKQSILTAQQRMAVGLCACASVPIVLEQLFGTNHLLRHISPAMIPLAITIGLLADQIFWTRAVAAIAVATALFAAQAAMIVYPVLVPNTTGIDIGFVNGTLPWRVLARFDQWNWQPVWEISRACHVDSARISYLGGGRELDPPAIEYPWVTAALPTRQRSFAYPDVTWLWRYEDGGPDWQKIENLAAKSDLVITAPNYLGEVPGKEEEDNRYNAQFAGWLAQDARFQRPIRLRMGRFQPVEVLVFPRAGLGCQLDQTAGAN